MTELERIKNYIKNTKCDMGHRYILSCGEITELANQDLFNTVSLAFLYGKAKGYRAAKAEMKAKQRAEVK